MSINYIPILMLILIFIFLIFINSDLSNRRGKLFSIVKVQWLLVGYIFVLLISTVIYHLSPIDSNTYEKVSAEGIPELWYAADNGTILDLDQKYIANEWDFDYKGDTLQLQAHYVNEANGVRTYIQKREDDENRVEGILYRTPTILSGGMEITSSFPQLNVDLNSNTLTLQNHESVHLKFSQYKKGFPFTQHTEEKVEDRMMEGPYLNRGEEVLLLRIPQSLEMEYDSQMNVEFVGW